MKRTLFLSFTAVMKGLAKGTVSDEDLRTGLFFFSCKRSHAIDPSGKSNEVQWFFENDLQAGFAAHRKLVEALLSAERDCRALWWRDISYNPDGKTNAYNTLDTLLTTHGYKTLCGDEHNYHQMTFYPQVVAQSVRKYNPDLVAVCIST